MVDAIFTAILLVMMKSGRFSGRCAQPPFLSSVIDGGWLIILHLTMHKGPERGPFFGTEQPFFLAKPFFLAIARAIPTKERVMHPHAG